jgi:hypothetical protein
MGDRNGAYRALVWETREGDHFEDIGRDGRIILKWIFMKWDSGMDWIDLSQGRDRWWAVVNAAMKLVVP